MQSQPVVISERGRPFATSPVAVQAIIMNADEQFLLLSSLRRNGENEWQVVSGGLEAGEAVLDGVLREVMEEAGDIQVRPLTVLHSQTFHYDANVRYMIGIFYLLHYEGGEVVPGDDMADSEYRWWGLNEFETAVANNAVVLHPSTHLWMLRRAVELVRLCGDEWPETAILQPPL